MTNGLERREVMEIVSEVLVGMASTLGLSHSISIQLCNVKKYYAKYETEIYLADDSTMVEYLHVITLSMRYMTNNYEVVDTLAHELCHAAQIESAQDPDHGETFDFFANMLREKYPELTIEKEGEYL